MITRGVLANNGGATETHALLPGSPAINTGDPAAMAGVGDVPLLDQRGAGYPRVFGVAIDIGALELADSSADFDGDNDIDGAGRKERVGRRLECGSEIH